MAENNQPDKLRCRICNSDVDAESAEDHLNTVHNFPNYVLRSFVDTFTPADFIAVCFFMFCNFCSIASTRTKIGIVMAFGVIRLTTSIFICYKSDKKDTCPFCDTTGFGNLVEHIQTNHWCETLEIAEKTKASLEADNGNGKASTSKHEAETYGFKDTKAESSSQKAENSQDKLESRVEKANNGAKNAETSNNEEENVEKPNNGEKNINLEEIDDENDGEANQSNGAGAQQDRQELGEKSDYGSEEEKYFSGEADSSSDATSSEVSVHSYISSGRRSSLQSLTESIILSESSESSSRGTPNPQR